MMKVPRGEILEECSQGDKEIPKGRVPWVGVQRTSPCKKRL